MGQLCTHVPITFLTIKQSLPLADPLLCQAGKLYGLLLAFHIHILHYQEIFKHIQDNTALLAKHFSYPIA